MTPELTAAVAARVELGASFRDAAQAAGVSPETARGWLRRGRNNPDGDCGDFARAIDAAREAAAKRPEPMSEAEFREHLEAAIRAGSTQAMKLWANTYLKSEEGGEDDDLGF